MLEVRKIKHELSFSEVRELIKIHTYRQTRMTTLLDYYNGKSIALNNMPKKPEGKADNRIPVPFAYLISSTICGFLNIPPVVKCENSEIQELIDDVFKYNDAPKQITSEILDTSIWGCSAEQLYLDSKGNTRFKRVDSRNLIVVKDSSIEEEMFLVIKHFEVDGLGEDTEEFVELYYEDKIIRYYQNEDGVHSITEEPHYFGDVPFVIFKNSEDMIGDFERVIPLIDSYSKYQSEILNAAQDITNSLMIISGCSLSDDQLRQVKNLRVLNDENNIDAKMVYNDIQYNDTYSSQLRKDIFSTSCVVDLTSSEEVGNLSGSALKNRLVNLLYLCSVKANYIKEAVLRRVELILNIHSLTHSIDVDDIIANTLVEVKYNTLEDDTATLALVNGLQDIISQETLLGLLGDLIVSVDDEMEKIAKEKQDNMEKFSFMQNQQGHLTHEEDTEEDTEEEPVDGDEDEEEETTTV